MLDYMTKRTAAIEASHPVHLTMRVSPSTSSVGFMWWKALKTWQQREEEIRSKALPLSLLVWRWRRSWQEEFRWAFSALAAPSWHPASKGPGSYTFQELNLINNQMSLKVDSKKFPLRAYLNWPLEWTCRYHKHRNMWSLPEPWSHIIGLCCFRSLTSYAFYRDSRKLKRWKIHYHFSHYKCW